MIKVVYFSLTGNTALMANKVAEGIENQGEKAKLIRFEDISVDDLKDDKVFALGCPAKGTEELDLDLVQPFMDDFKDHFKGKTVALFGSYGWGDGQWMRDWVSLVEENGAKVLNGEGVICLESPDNESEQACLNLGKELAKSL